jgi:DNA anti-recombination protein RmuC
MDIKIRNEIIRLKRMKELHHASYITTLDMNEDKLRRIDEQIEKTASIVKKDILEKQRQMYQNEIEKFDRNIEQITNFVNNKIEALENQLVTMENEKHSLAHNIDMLKKAIVRRNTNDIFDMFEYVTNALIIINDGSSNTQPHS